MKESFSTVETKEFECDVFKIILSNHDGKHITIKLLIGDFGFFFSYIKMITLIKILTKAKEYILEKRWL